MTQWSSVVEFSSQSCMNAINAARQTRCVLKTRLPNGVAFVTGVSVCWRTYLDDLGSWMCFTMLHRFVHHMEVFLLCHSGSKCARIALLDNRFGHEPDEPYEIDTPVNKLPHICLSFVCKEVQHEARVKVAHFYEVLQGIASKWPSRIGWHWHLRAGYVRSFLFLSLLLVHGARSYALFVATWICNLLWWLCGILDDCWHVFFSKNLTCWTWRCLHSWATWRQILHLKLGSSLATGHDLFEAAVKTYPFEPSSTEPSFCWFESQPSRDVIQVWSCRALATVLL